MNEILMAAAWFVIGFSAATILGQLFIVDPLMKQVTFLRGKWLQSMTNHLDLMLMMMGVESNFTKGSDGSAVSPYTADQFKKGE